MPARAPTDGATDEVEPARGYPRAKARTRAALLAAARQVMAEKGVEGATIADIASRAGVSPGTFYNHFGDMPAILDALVADLVRGLDEALAEVGSFGRSPAETFAIGIDRILRFADEDPVWSWCMIRFEGTVESMRDALHRRAVANFASGVKAGLYARGLPLVPVTDMLIGTLITSGLSRIQGRATQDDNAAVAEVLLRSLGVAPDEARRAVAVLGPRPDEPRHSLAGKGRAQRIVRR